MRSQRPSLNLTEQFSRIITDLCARIPELQHIDSRRVLVCVSRTRRVTPGGVYAKIVPMRYPDGSQFKRVNGSLYTLPQIPTEHGDVLYVIYVYVPRFLAESLERRLLILIHELYHIAPAFDGTIRRFGGRAHGNSRSRYNDRLQPLVENYLAASPPDDLLAFLRTDLDTLLRGHTLVGQTLRLPKAVRLG